jgi:lysophospholipase L1-like esterase
MERTLASPSPPTQRHGPSDASALLRARVRERLLVAAGGMVALLLVLELALRLLGNTAPVPQASGRLDAALLDCPACPRVLCVGDSFTFGVGAGAHGDYPSQLEILLNRGRSGLPVRVVNAGVAGGNTSGVLRALPDFLRVTQPSAIVVMVGGTNRMNRFGFEAWRHGSGWVAAVEGAAFELRVLRLLGFVRAQLFGAGGGASVAASPALTRQTMIDSFLRWWDRSHGTPIPAELEQALALLVLDQHQAAVSALEAAAEAEPEGAHWAWALGLAHRQVHQNAEAERWFQRAVALDPSDPNAYFALGHLSMDRGAPSAEALSWLRRGVDAEPSFAANYCGQAPLVARLEGHRAALEILLAGVRTDPEEGRCYPDLRESAMQLGEWELLERELQALAARSPRAREELGLLELGLDDQQLWAWTRDELEDIVDLALAQGVPVVLQTYPMPDPTNALLAELAASRSLALVDQERRFQDRLRDGGARGDYFVPDGHCNDAGYRVMAEGLAATLAPLLSER